MFRPAILIAALQPVPASATRKPPPISISIHEEAALRHMVADMEVAERYWGSRCASAYAWRTLLDHGTTLAFGSDAPVERLDVFAGLHAAVARTGPGRQPPT